ncbi:MAG: hypothetical protein WED00_14520 [Aquisalimonadaceae bacterium]
MASPLRLDENLVREAEAEARLNRRSVPKQIEFWADLGKKMARLVSPEDLIKVQMGLRRIQVEDAQSFPVDVNDVFASLDAERERGTLAHAVTRAAVSYQAVPGRPGVLERIDRDGRRQQGAFRDGEFVPEP